MNGFREERATLARTAQFIGFTMLTATEVTGPDCALITLLAHVIRKQGLDDGHVRLKMCLDQGP